MSLVALSTFLFFAHEQFLAGKRFLYLKSSPWVVDGKEMGSKVVVQIIEDTTQYGKPGVSNFGEQLTIKIRDLAPSAFSQLKPLATEVVITDVERAVVYGEYRNNLSIIGKIGVKDAQSK